MPTKLPTQAVDILQVLVQSKSLDVKRIESKELDAKNRSVIRPLLKACFRGTSFLLMLPLSVTLSGGTALAQANPHVANADYQTSQVPQLLAQQVIDGLPPPPPIPDLQVPNDDSLPQGSGPHAGSQEETGEIYLVYVNGDSPLLLEQVRQVEPTARIQALEGQQVILAGLFDRSSTANEQIEKLDQRGIDANVVSVSSVVLSPNAPTSDMANSGTNIQSLRASLDDLPPADPVSTAPRTNSSPRPNVSVAPPSVTSSPPSSTITNAPRRDNAYYVVIPGNEDELMEMREQVVLLGAVSNAVEQRDRPLGPHLLVGPFVNQDAATRWNRFFQDFGMDARVYYKR